MISITHPIKQLINSQYGFLSSMLDRFPNLLDKWIKKQEKENEQLAKIEANGDIDVYLSISHWFVDIADSYGEEEQLFNQAMLIMVYSYYESTLLRLSKEIQEDEARPSIIANHFGKDLDDEMLKISNYLFKTIAPLRNQLCHNNQGTLFARSTNRREEQIENVEKLVERKFITIDDGRIVSIDRAFIKNILDGERKLLLKLAEICGFKTKWCVYEDGKMVVCENYDEIKERGRGAK